MHRCLIFSMALSAQFLACLCYSAYPLASRQQQQQQQYPALSSSLQGSEEDFQAPPSGTASTFQNLQYRPRLLNLLQLGLLSQNVRQNQRQSDPSSESDSEEDLRLEKRLQGRGDSFEPNRQRMMLPPTKAPPKKMSGLGLDRPEGRLSIVNPLDVLRQKLIMNILQEEAERNQRVVEENRQMLDRIGKRNVLDYTTEERTYIRPNHQRLAQMLSSMTSPV